MQKYEQMIVAQQKNKKIEQKETEYLEFLEKILTLESILDIRSMIKVKYKVTIYVCLFVAWTCCFTCVYR